MVAMMVDLDLETVRHFLRERLLNSLNDLPPALRADIVEALAVEGKLFHEPATRFDGRWALLPLYFARALRAEVDPSYSCAAALAMECLICATDLFDDVMDEDVTPFIERSGVAQTLNVALALLSLPQRILLALAEQHPGSSLPACLLDAVQRALLLAIGGQQQDLLAERRLACELSREDCIEIAAAKAGSLLGLACRLAALCAGVEETLVERCAELGRLLGIAAQLDNDAHDLARLLRPVDGGCRKSDLRRGKKTLPVVLAAHSLRERCPLEPGEIDRIFQGLSALAGEEREVYFAALHEGVVATWGVSLLYRERARECINEVMGTGSMWELVLSLFGFESSLAEINDW